MDKSELNKALEALTAEKTELEAQLSALKEKISSLEGKSWCGVGMGWRFGEKFRCRRNEDRGPI